MIKNFFKQINKKITEDKFRFRFLLMGSILIFLFIAVIALIANFALKQTNLIFSSLLMIAFGSLCLTSCFLLKNKIKIVGDVFIFVVTIILFLMPLDGNSDSYYLVWPVIYPVWVLLLLERKKGSIYTFVVLGILMLLFWTPLNNIPQLSGFNPDYSLRVIIAMFSTYLLVLMFEFVRISLIEKYRISKEKYEKLSKIDYLTGINNRYVFNKTIAKMLEKNANKKEMAVFMIDFDDFKKCNDKGGHFFGDFILKKAAFVMKNMLKENDTICRWGGEEFMIVSEGISENEAKQKAEELRECIENEVFIDEIKKIELKLTVSIGYVHFMPTKNTKPEEIFNFSDQYMYNAKKNGKNRAEGVKI